MTLYLCEDCDQMVSGMDLGPITNYTLRAVRSDRALGGQCPCGGLCYEATDDDKINHAERDPVFRVKQGLNEIFLPKELRTA